MPGKIEARLEQWNISRKDRGNLRQIVTALSLVVILAVFWSLKLTGIGIAGEAFCGHEEHTHGEGCLQKTLVCTQEESSAHVHTEACLHRELTCTSEEETHVHEEACWTVSAGFGCGAWEKDGHVHTADCLTEETLLDCELPAGDGHTHTDDCYEITGNCTLEEHTHVENCYSNVNADLETEDDWEMTFADMVRGPTLKENVVLVAQSQLGYTESVLNFQLDANGTRRGITRYGQWYGNPYGEWSAMFVSFCLEYAGAGELPRNAGPESMRQEWEAEGLFRSADQWEPEVGSLVFLRKGEVSVPGATSVGILVSFNDATLTVIEGDVENSVAETQYRSDDPIVMGYGVIPETNGITLMDVPSTLAADCTVWLDGTDGGLRHLNGAPNTAYTAAEGSTIQLPATWTSASKYSYTLRGWYDITNDKYYPAGGQMTVTGDAVLYADWVASTYDLGQFNAKVAETVSTNAFITTHMFDYNYLFNVQSSNVQSTISATTHSETWSMVSSGNVKYKNNPTLNLIFAEADSSGELSNPRNRTDRNSYHSATTISSGIYDAEIGELLYSPDNAFDPVTGTGVIGKTYLGTGDHLFQIMDDPNDEHYGYYYYDSLRNAISFHQTNKRFYVYEYLSATSDAMGGSNADFLPLNSPYANTNGKTPATYTYDGTDGEYQGVTHYRYDTDYSGGSYNSDKNVNTEFAYGMRSDINFFLPNDPGSGGNKDLYGNDIQFQFSGDDDLWVLIDGKVVLDIGGIHQRIAGEINFSTGQVTVNGKAAPSLQDLEITSGDHTLTVLYLERGASMSNCSIYFNLVPRFGLDIQKEDVLTQELLNGTQFTVYEDYACTKPAELWESEQAYHQDLSDGISDRFQSTFTVQDGVARLWGLGSGSTYYIKETGPPAAEGYGVASGVICMTIEKAGLATYRVEVMKEADGTEPSKGFTVHGVHIDEETKQVFMIVTNAPETVTDTTTVQVIKQWEDKSDHSNDYIQAYLTVIEPDGTVRRIREITLSDENDWTYIWTNLPEKDYDNLSEVTYGIEESYESGYYSTVRKITQLTVSDTKLAEATEFRSGETYYLKHTNGYLSTTSDSDTKLKWVDEETALGSKWAAWTVTVSGGKVKFTNGADQVLTMNNRTGNRYFYAVKGSSTYQSFTPVETSTGFRFYLTTSSYSSTYYYLNTLSTSNGRITTTTSSANAMILKPMRYVTVEETMDFENWAYLITNTPLSVSNETSFSVTKEWNVPAGQNSSLYQEFSVTVRLLANGLNTGRTLTLNLKNNWQATFQGLPYKDEQGNVIKYTVEEIWSKERWTTHYGEIQLSGGSIPTYSVVITNAYHPGGPELPSTGSPARIMCILCGVSIMLTALIYGIGSRRKRERRMK